MTDNKPYVDMWYGDKKEEADKITVTFYDRDNEYRGNIYKNDQAIGDFVVKSSLQLEKMFPQIAFNWDYDYSEANEPDEEYQT